MLVGVVPLRAIFEMKMCIEVPVFQRPYAWTQERQWEPLWEDIAYKFKHYLSRENRPGHFLGAIILAHVDTAITHVQKRQIIDGQQRLITMQIFISAFRDFCREQGVLGLADECEKYTRNTGWGVDKETRFKVYPKKPDREQFEDVIFSESKSDIEAKHPPVRERYARRINPRPPMIESYLFFHSQISEFFKISEESRETLPFGEKSQSMEKRLADCFNAIGQGLQVVTIDLSREDDPQVIFEALNARGEPLSCADLIRNDIFRRAGSERDELYERYWEPLEAKVEKGRLDQFMHCYLTSQMGSYTPIQIKHVYYEYKNWIGRDNSPFDSNVEEELKALHRFGTYFQYLVEPRKCNPFYEIAVFLKSVGIGAVYPFLLTVMDLLKGETRERISETCERISTIIESYLIRRFICHSGSRNYYNRLFVELTGKLRSGFSTDRIAEFFLGKEGPSNEWPSDDDFRKYWFDYPMDAIGHERLKYILKRLNESYMSDWSEKIPIDDETLTIEHILPQNWIAFWPLPNGENGLSEEERVDATEKRNAALHTIGNLTILTPELNSSLSNNSWEEKQEKIFKHSTLPINRYFQDIAEWNEEQIAIRSEVLFQKALELWPRG